MPLSLIQFECQIRQIKSHFKNVYFGVDSCQYVPEFLRLSLSYGIEFKGTLHNFLLAEKVAGSVSSLCNPPDT